MATASLSDCVLEYRVVGQGEVVVCVHGALIADAFDPLVAEPSLARNFQILTYHRRGYGGSSRFPGPISVRQHAQDLRELLDHLRMTEAHIVGHSYGGSIALQLALDAPDLVASLAVFEPALILGNAGQSHREATARNEDRYRAGDAEGAVDYFLRLRFGPDFRAVIAHTVPGGIAQAIGHAGTALVLELPGLADWEFNAEQASRIRQPTLLVLGSESEALWSRFGETHRSLLAWLPLAEEFILPRATHAMQMQNPEDLAGALLAFLRRHAISGLPPPP